VRLTKIEEIDRSSQPLVNVPILYPLPIWPLAAILRPR
jgi:hypothetical protein